ncbi:uncharacterized protein LOC141853720 [Brevipalpus obovatus]|uniref:uncharacterized protein LOC141853720 n=1 Tax=Brevipalpus obovatus TaxID=246614 RepID=UPI003D9EAEFE
MMDSTDGSVELQVHVKKESVDESETPIPAIAGDSDFGSVPLEQQQLTEKPDILPPQQIFEPPPVINESQPLSSSLVDDQSIVVTEIKDEESMEVSEQNNVEMTEGKDEPNTEVTAATTTVIATTSSAMENDDEYEDDDDDDDDDDVQVTIEDIKATTPPFTQVNYINIPKFGPGGQVSKAGFGKNKATGLDIDAVGTYNGQPIYDLNLDSMEDKPWRKPGADITDYFNYGFTEETWKIYCERQKKIRSEILGNPHSESSLSASPGSSLKPIANQNKSDMPIPVASVNENSKYSAMGLVKKAGPPPGRKPSGKIDVIGGGTPSTPSVITSRRPQEIDNHNHFIQVINHPPPQPGPPNPPFHLPPPGPPPPFMMPPQPGMPMPMIPNHPPPMIPNPMGFQPEPMREQDLREIDSGHSRRRGDSRERTRESSDKRDRDRRDKDDKDHRRDKKDSDKDRSSRDDHRDRRDSKKRDDKHRSRDKRDKHDRRSSRDRSSDRSKRKR